MKLWKMLQSWGFHQFRKFQLSQISGVDQKKRIDSTGIFTVYIGTTPTQDSSHLFQDYEPFLVGNPNLNLPCVAVNLGGG